MIILIQRVNSASIRIDGRCHASIGRGLLAFLGIEAGDDRAIAERLVDKMISYRVFPDREGRMNLSLKDIDGELLLVSQFTLAASTDQGLRPGFSTAMRPESAKALYSELVTTTVGKFPRTRSGVFGADMKIELENDGPVTFILKG